MLGSKVLSLLPVGELFQKSILSMPEQNHWGLSTVAGEPHVLPKPVLTHELEGSEQYEV